MVGIGIVFGVIVLLAVILLILSFRGFAQQQERFIIERFGKFNRAVGPGIMFVLPFIERVRAVENIWEQGIPLFEDPIKIDFTDGSATPKGTVAWVRIQSLYNVIYNISDWRIATRDLLENALRSYFQTLGIDDALIQKGAGFDLKNKLPHDEVVRIDQILDRWGLELMQVTVLDFDLEPDLVAARGEVQKREKASEAALFERQKRSRETVGFLIQTMADSTGRPYEEIQTEVRDNPQLQERIRNFAEEVVTRQMSIDGKALTDIRVGGASDLESSLLRIITAIRGTTGR